MKSYSQVDNKFHVYHFKDKPVNIDIIYALWRKYSKTLGFFPKGAFEEYAEKNQIILAFNDKEDFIGYLLYRLPDRHVSITHLCVDSNYRGNGLPNKLFSALKNVTSGFDGVSLSCRRDYGIQKLWSNLGFKAMTERKGKGKNGAVVTSWWYDYGNETIFSQLFESDEATVQVAVDANIFIDFNERSAVSEESKALLADWLADKINIFLTPEIYNEIDRCNDIEKRELERIRVSYFDVLPNYPDHYDLIEEGLRKMYPPKISEQDKSDIRQLSHAIAANIEYFITRDDNVLKKSDLIYEKYSISVIRPSEFIVNIDRLEKYDDYKPSRFVGTHAKIHKINDFDEDLFSKCFQKHELGETKHEFLQKLRGVLKDPVNNDCYIIRRKNNELIGMLCYVRKGNGELDVPLIRAIKSNLEYTIIHYLAFKATIDSYTSSNVLTKISDDYVCNDVKKVLFKNGFSKSDNDIVRLNINKSGSASDIANYIRDFNINSQCVINVLRFLEDADLSDKEISWNVEKLIWPGKVLDANINNFIISIKPGWARELFDHDLSGADLFGSTLELALNVEGAYYRSVKNTSGLSGSSRILWYVSTDSQYKAYGIKACSQLEEVVIAKPKEAYKEFRRLGVYDWKNIYSLANNDIEKDVMVLRFKNTEVFKNPVSYDSVRDIFKKNNIGMQLLSPTRVSSDVFDEIYSLGVI